MKLNRAPTPKKQRPWIRWDVTSYQDAALRIAACAGVWPWVLSTLKLNGGSCTDIDLNSRLCSLDLGFPEPDCLRQLESMKHHALLVQGDDERWRARNWDCYQIDPRPHSRDRPKRGKSNTGTSGKSRTVPKDSPGVPGLTGRDGTRQDRSPPLQGDPRWVFDIPDSRRSDAGISKWTACGVQDALRRLWPNERQDRRSLLDFCKSLAGLPAGVVDAVLLEISPDGAPVTDPLHNRPYCLKPLITKHRRQQAKGPATRASNQNVLSEGLSAQVEQLARNDDDLWELTQDFISAGEQPPAEIKALIFDLCRRRGVQPPAMLR